MSDFFDSSLPPCCFPFNIDHGRVGMPSDLAWGCLLVLSLLIAFAIACFQCRRTSSESNPRHRRMRNKLRKLQKLVETQRCDLDEMNKCIVAVSSFSTMSPTEWFTIQTLPYPQAVPLSMRRNHGWKKGPIKITDTGVKFLEAGYYDVTITVVLFNPVSNYTALIPVFLVPNGVFDPNALNNIGSVVTLSPNSLQSVSTSGPLLVDACSSWSIIATNGGSPEPQPVTVAAWSVSVAGRICSVKDSC